MPREADNRGNITSETRNGVTVTYEYDELGQLTRVNDPGDPAADSDNGTTWLFTYDRGGNILSKQAYVLSSAAQPTEIRQNLVYGYTDANWKDKLTHFCNDELTYDAIGNLTDDTQWTYTWEKGRQLKSMHNAATGVTMEFKYNHEGLRTRKVKKVNGTVTETTDYILKGKHIVAMKKNTDTYYFTYDASGKPATVTYNGVKYTYVKNLQGDIVGILDTTGTLVVEYRYDAWGAPTSILCVNIACDNLAFDNPFRYRGYVWDEETGLYYLRSRYYDPEWGRQLNEDHRINTTLGIIGVNAYTYCLNSPIMKIDHNGQKPGDLFATMDEAARDFAVYINMKSIKENREYASAMYSVTVNEAYYVTVEEKKKFLWWSFNTHKKTRIDLPIKYFTYTEPIRGEMKHVRVPLPQNSEEHVAVLHTHGAYNIDYAVDRFSSQDRDVARQLSIPIYVATPGGMLLKYDPSFVCDLILFDDIPHDPNHPKWSEKE